MNGITRRGFLELAAIGLGGLAVGEGWTRQSLAAEPSSNFEKLSARFLDPDRKYSIRPFWFWNGELNGDELGRQIRQMVEHGVYGAYVHNRDGLQTPYLSEAWWQAVGQALKSARESGFSLCMVDEFEWPSGEARDYWLPGINKSRVLEANPEFHMQRLRPEETIVKGPKRVAITLPKKTAAVVVARRVGRETLDGGTLKSLPLEHDVRQFDWNAPEGEWIVIIYGIEPAIGQPDHGTVDLMSREAIAKYIEIYYEEFYRRYGEYFGNALPATFADHEGDYGAKLPWTPRLFETFLQKRGYALEPFLPALTYDIGTKTEKVRCDLLDTVSELYCESFFRQVTDWCHQHNIEHSGHVWEESLFFGPAEQGDFFRILRSMSNPGCDTLVEWGRQSVWLKEVASVADFEGRHVVCENQGVQGEDSYLSPERMRRVSNCLGAWNIGEFIPHAFDYDLSRINYPPDWFRSQPYLEWFRAYADQMRRISFVNRESLHIADILLLYPQVSVWGQSAPAFRSENIGNILDNSFWSQDAAETNQFYAELKLRLSDERLDYKVADDHYLKNARIEGKRLHISESSFQVLILPPMSTIRRGTAGQVRKFFQAGGTVIALRRLATASVESGRNDPALIELWSDVFDNQPTWEAFRLKKNDAGGQAYFVPGGVPDILEIIRRVTDPDVEVVEGPTQHLYVLHKQKEGFDLYWVVNDTPESRTNTLRLRAHGRAERWDAATGHRSPLFYQSQGERTTVRLPLGPWDAAYIAFDPAGARQPLSLTSTTFDDLYIQQQDDSGVKVRGKALISDRPLVAVLSDGRQQFKGHYTPQHLEPVEVAGTWKVTVEAASIPIPYVGVMEDPGGRGLQEHWERVPDDRMAWRPFWLSPMSYAIHEWNVIGPFPNPGDRGLEVTYPPETEINYHAIYTGDEDRQLHWKSLNTVDYQTGAAGGGWNLGTVEITGGPYGADSFIANYGRPLRLSPTQGTVFAQTNVYCPRDQDARLVMASPNPSAIFLNGVKVYSRWLRPLYNEMTDGFAAFVSVHLRTGWNSLLLKFLHNPKDPRSPHFFCRIQGRDGSRVQGAHSSLRQSGHPKPEPSLGYRWLQVAIPPVAGELVLSPMQSSRMAFIDGKAASAEGRIPLPAGSRSVRLRVSSSEVLDRPWTFSTQPTHVPLGTWNVPGLEHFSGRMTYEKQVDVPESLLAEQVLLDCGVVGVVAEAWINGNSLGSRAWAPFVFDVGKHLRAGQNQVRVRIANTEANARAVGSSRSILKEIDINGWHGPARLVPFVDREIECTAL